MNKFLISAATFLLAQMPTFAATATKVATKAATTKSSELAALQTLVSKFSISMLGIAAFSVVIFLGLTFYNRFFVSRKINNYTLKENSLKAPETVSEALYMFIEKNKLV